MVTAKLKNYRQSPRKVRVVGNLVKGKTVPHAIEILTYTAKSASLPLKKLIQSAAQNAKQNANLAPESLIVKDLRVDGGIVLKRNLPKARGSASMIKKRTSNVIVILDEKKNA